MELKGSPMSGGSSRTRVLAVDDSTLRTTPSRDESRAFFDDANDRTHAAIIGLMRGIEL
jgi:hypothetical protein